jgi:hypothetical protein
MPQHLLLNPRATSRRRRFTRQYCGVLRANFHPLGIQYEDHFLQACLTRSMRTLASRRGLLHVIIHLQGLQHANRRQRRRLLTLLDRSRHLEHQLTEPFRAYLMANTQIQRCLRRELRRWYSLHLMTRGLYS